MKHFLLATGVALWLITLSSCSTTIHSSTAHTRNVNETAIRETASIADLKVDEQKVTGTSTGVKTSDETVKNLAVYDAVKKVNADVLVEPNYDIDHTGNSVTVTVTGFPGFYKNFRRPTEQDSLIMGWKVIMPVTTAPGTNTDGNTTVNITTTGVNLQQGVPVYNTQAPVNRSTNFIDRAYQSITTPSVKTKPVINYDVDAYKREKRKAGNFLGWGITLLISGVIIDGCSPLAIDNSYEGSNQQNYTPDLVPFYTMLGVGTAMVVAGCALLPVGSAHLRKARQIKNAGLAQDLHFSIMPNFNIASSHYGGTFALNF